MKKTYRVFAACISYCYLDVEAESEEEAREDIEISFAALERRAPEIAGRNSPAKNQAVLGGK